MPSLSQFAVWIAIGFVGGSLAGMAVARARRGFGLVRNLGLGLIGAVVGGLIFRIFGLLTSLDSIAVSLRDVVDAFMGSLLVLVVIWLWQLRKAVMIIVGAERCRWSRAVNTIRRQEPAASDRRGAGVA
jgi:uncharacterized membrane protein YeaQ/YmgE (transglycosylase-associated protein family)